MPIQHSVSVCKKDDYDAPENTLSRVQCLGLLREYECLAYHHVCEAFRAQGVLTPEKRKLLKELAAALYIPDVRHQAECRMAINNEELSAIAESMAGPNNELEWQREVREDFLPPQEERRVPTAYLQLCDELSAATEAAMAELRKAGDPKATKTIEIKCMRWVDSNGEVGLRPINCTPRVKNEVNEEDRDGESSSSVSTTTEPSEEETQLRNENQNTEKATNLSTDHDMELMPPPPPLITVPPPSPVITIPTPPPVINIPPPSPVITVPPPAPVITVPPPTSITVIPATSKSLTLPVSVAPTPEPMLSNVPQLSPIPPSEVPVPQPVVEVQQPLLSESDDVQFLSFSESLDSSLPPLVVVPPAEPVITVPHSSSFSPSTPTLVLPSGMSIQLREDSGEGKKRKRSVTQDASSSPAPKTMALSQISKMTPVMVSTGVTGQGQVKVTPISRSKVAVTPQTTYATNIPSSTQKVIIVSNPSSTNSPSVQRSLTMPVGVPIIRGAQQRLQTVPGMVQTTSAMAKLRPKMVTVPAKCRAKGGPLVIPMANLKNTITLKQDNVTVVDTSSKRVPISGPAKILPKPQGPMYIVNPSPGTHKIATSIGGQTTRMISPRMVTQASLSEATSSTSLKPGTSKQNVVILQKGGGGSQRSITLTNTSKDLMQKLMSKKCVVIQSSKVMPKAPPLKSTPPITSSPGSNVVVLDLSQEQYRQNLSSTTIAEILQASGIMTSSATHTVTTTPPQSTAISAPEPSWLPVEASKSLSLEEVTLPLGQTESIVTLDKAVELLGEETAQSQLQTEHPSSHALHLEVGDTPDQIFTITPEELAASDISFLSDKPLPDNLEEASSQIVIDTLSTEQAVDNEDMSEPFLPHRDGAVTIQHSNFDMPPANLCLEDYSSQQLE